MTDHRCMRLSTDDLVSFNYFRSMDRRSTAAATSMLPPWSSASHLLTWRFYCSGRSPFPPPPPHHHRNGSHHDDLRDHVVRSETDCVLVLYHHAAPGISRIMVLLVLSPSQRLLLVGSKLSERLLLKSCAFESHVSYSLLIPPESRSGLPFHKT